MSDISKVEEIGSTVDTLTIAGAVYELCGDIKNGIEAKRNALLLVPNDTGWFITSTLVFSLYKDGQIGEIYKLIGDDIYAEDMPGRVVALLLFSSNNKVIVKKQRNYSSWLKRIILIGKNSIDNLMLAKRAFRKTINGLLKLGSLE